MVRKRINTTSVTPTTNARTKIFDDDRQRFKIHDRVKWNETISAVIESFDAERRFAIVKTNDGHFLTWPVRDERLRYSQTPTYDTPSDLEEELTTERNEKIEQPTIQDLAFASDATAPEWNKNDDDYEAISVEETARKTRNGF